MEERKEPGRLASLLQDDSGVGVVEVVLILVVIVALVIIFRDQITGLINRIFGGVNSGVDTLMP
jgi:Flp pilus assembly pilin Flp